MIRFLFNQFIQCLFSGINAPKIQIYSVKYMVIGNAALNNIISLVFYAFATISIKIKPFAIVGFKQFV